jgi:hypothetical protein
MRLVSHGGAGLSGRKAVMLLSTATLLNRLNKKHLAAWLRYCGP